MDPGACGVIQKSIPPIIWAIQKAIYPQYPPAGQKGFILFGRKLFSFKNEVSSL